MTQNEPNAMNAARCIKILTAHNAWRRGEEPYENGGEPWPNTPREIGEAIDFAVEEIGRLTKQVEAMQWRDIASAPKDGTLIDLWVTWMPGTPNKEVRSYRVPKCFWNHKGKKWDTLCYTHDGKRQMYGETPTHWMPLPHAPVSADNGD